MAPSQALNGWAVSRRAFIRYRLCEDAAAADEPAPALPLIGSSSAGSRDSTSCCKKSLLCVRAVK